MDSMYENTQKMIPWYCTILRLVEIVPLFRWTGNIALVQDIPRTKFTGTGSIHLLDEQVILLPIRPYFTGKYTFVGWTGG